MTGLVQDLGVMGGSGLAKDDTRAMRRFLDTSGAEGAQLQPVSVAVASPVFSRSISSSLTEAKAATVSATVPEQERKGHLKSKSVAWKDPEIMLERMSMVKTHVKVTAMGKGPQREVTKQKFADEFQGSSRMARILRVLGMNGSKKVHAAKGEWLNYDAQSYAMNFEKDPETVSRFSQQQLPKISGPGAREIVTVILQRSPSTNRNGGFALIPRPVYVVKKEQDNPLWKRRAVQAPAKLDLKCVGAGRKKWRGATGASKAAK